MTDAGLVTVTDVAPGTEASVTVQADKPGQTLPGTGTANGTSLYGPARTPVFDDEALERVEGGFAVPVTVWVPVPGGMVTPGPRP